MPRSIRALTFQGPWAWAGVLFCSLALAGLVGWTYQLQQEEQRLSLLHAEAQRTSLLIISKTLNGELMGAVATLGLLDTDVKLDANAAQGSRYINTFSSLTILGNAFSADGVSVVGSDGVVRSSWARRGPSATGLNVGIRPYFRAALDGKASVYGALSLRTGERALYLAAPVYPEYFRSGSGIGAVVTHTDLKQLDALLSSRPDNTLLLSPGGVVFAGSEAAWIGYLDRRPDAKSLAEIRKLKQFGTLFDADTAPGVLPWAEQDGLASVDGRRLAVASAAVPWNDTSGDWRLVLTENLARTAPLLAAVRWGAVAAAISFVLGALLLITRRSHRAQVLIAQRLQQHVREQEEHGAYRGRLMAATLRMQRCLTLAELAQVFLHEARSLIGALQGTVYVADPAQPERLLLAGAAACATAPETSLISGRGLLGQCLIERQVLVIATPPDGFWTLRSGLGETRPQALLLAPLLLQDRVIGALELAVSRTPDERLLERFNDLVTLLATHLEIQRGGPSTQAQAQTQAQRPAHQHSDMSGATA